MMYLTVRTYGHFMPAPPFTYAYRSEVLIFFIESNRRLQYVSRLEIFRKKYPAF